MEGVLGVAGIFALAFCAAFFSIGIWEKGIKMRYRVILFIVSLGFLVGAFFSFSTMRKYIVPEPTPLDVYKGKTQMVLDYNVDGTCDTIVVWKGDKK